MSNIFENYDSIISTSESIYPASYSFHSFTLWSNKSSWVCWNLVFSLQVYIFPIETVLKLCLLLLIYLYQCFRFHPTFASQTSLLNDLFFPSQLRYFYILQNIDKLRESFDCKLLLNNNIFYFISYTLLNIFC